MDKETESRIVARLICWVLSFFGGMYCAYLLGGWPGFWLWLAACYLVGHAVEGN